MAWVTAAASALRRAATHLARIRYRILLINAIVAAVPLVGISFAEMHESQLLAAAEADMIHQAELVRAMVLVDITPGVTAEKAKAITDFVNGPASFPSFDDLLKRTMEHNPTRSEASLRRGILHNAEQREDGSWVWRYARHRQVGPNTGEGEKRVTDRTDLWDVIAGYTGPLLLVRGMRPQSVVDDKDETELQSRNPAAEVVRVQEAGHSVQGDTPVELAEIIQGFVP